MVNPYTGSALSLEELFKDSVSIVVNRLEDSTFCMTIVYKEQEGTPKKTVTFQQAMIDFTGGWLIPLVK